MSREAVCQLEAADSGAENHDIGSDIPLQLRERRTVDIKPKRETVLLMSWQQRTDVMILRDNNPADRRLVRSYCSMRKVSKREAGASHRMVMDRSAEMPAEQMCEGC